MAARPTSRRRRGESSTSYQARLRSEGYSEAMVMQALNDTVNDAVSSYGSDNCDSGSSYSSSSSDYGSSSDSSCGGSDGGGGF